MSDIPDPALQEIATTFRCHPTMAVAIADRIRERLGQPVSNAEIARVMKSIPMARLSIDAVIVKLEQRPSRKTRASAISTGPEDTRPPAAPKETLQERLTLLLAENWKRAAANHLPVTEMSTREFLKAVRSYTGHKDAPLRRILKAALALDHEDVVLNPHVVADRVNALAVSEDKETP